MNTTRAVLLRTRTLGAVAALLVGGAATVALLSVPSVPSATASKDPCVASELARTVGKAVTSTGDYLDSHPDTNQVLTGALQQQPGPQTLADLKSYFDANPKVGDDLAKITAPVTEVSDRCKLAVNLPQVLGLLQAAQGQGGLPGGLPGGGLPVSGPPAGGVTQPIAVR
ncbi:hemophore [Mycolicibacter algericus DSM 45454]|uniref:Hemophore n=1 Tax=Mycolicibacter algericus DSM 45454 TaxID=723879 RepID=A0ABX3RXK0_MYCAL|nr:MULTISPECIES: hemophore [Mycolicibacter]OQZ98921.1 hemophore [Mycolicibacter algericus DSM 45454]